MRMCKWWWWFWSYWVEVLCYGVVIVVRLSFSFFFFKFDYLWTESVSVDLLLSHLWKAEIPWIFFFLGIWVVFTCLCFFFFFFNVLSSFMPISSYLLVLLQKSFSEKKQKSYHVNRFCRTFSNIYGLDGGFERIKEVRS